MRKLASSAVLSFISFLILSSPSFAQDPAALASRARQVLVQNCGRCHAGGTADASQGGFSFVTDLQKLINADYVTPGNPEDSFLMDRIRRGEMPPAGSPRMSTADTAALNTWISEGAPTGGNPPARIISNAEIRRIVREDLEAAAANNPVDAKSRRYLTLTHLRNAGAQADVYRSLEAAVSVLINSVSFRAAIVRPVELSAGSGVYRIDVRNYNIRAETWDAVAAQDPYHLEFDSADQEVITDLSGSKSAIVRADWFASTSAIPPAYHNLLNLPAKLQDLERLLTIDTKSNLELSTPSNRLALRAGFGRSGVSRNNRAIERHTSPYGGYWKSFDFASSTGTKNIFSNPLGSGGTLGFVEDGGEVIFNLPNGLQAYYINNAQGARLNVAPAEIVFDAGRPPGIISNGLSCMGCHAQGLIVKLDEIAPLVRSSDIFDATAKQKVRNIYGTDAELRAAFAEDSARHRRAMIQAGLPESSTGGVVVPLVDHFEAPLDLVNATAELGLSPERFAERLRAASTDLQREMAVLQATTMNRETFRGLFPRLVDELDLEEDVDDSNRIIVDQPNLNLPITDNTTQTATFEVGRDDVVKILKVTLVLTHTAFGDLRFELETPDGTRVALPVGNGASGRVTKEYRTRDLAALRVVKDKPARGVWKLRVSDGAGGDSGTFRSARLVIN